MTLTAFPWQNAIASLLALVGAVLVLWPGKKQDKVDPHDRLVSRAQYIVTRIRNQRRPQWIRHQIEPLGDVIRDGVSSLLMFEQAGFAVPQPTTTEAERFAITLECYFSGMIPLLRDGHIEMAKTHAAKIAERAIAEGASLKPEEWLQHGL